MSFPTIETRGFKRLPAAMRQEGVRLMLEAGTSRNAIGDLIGSGPAFVGHLASMPVRPFGFGQVQDESEAV